MKARILFVDDDPMVLSGLQRSLRQMRSEWEMEFVNDPAEALRRLTAAAYDIIVSDMRMPQMSGCDLLEAVREANPGVLRFVLSGQADRESILKSANPAHQYLSKPCDPDNLKQALARALTLRELLKNPGLQELVAHIRTLPSLPTLYQALLRGLADPQSSLKSLATILEQDIAMTSKILQLANSAFFGHSARVSSPAQALSLLGIETVKSLTLSYGVFSSITKDGSQRAERLEALWTHSTAVASGCHLLAESEGLPRTDCDDAFSAGLLHDIGELIILSECPDAYERVLQLAADTHISRTAAEAEILGCTHEALGAYLLGAWGLPGAVTEAVGWHHNPSTSSAETMSPLALVHFVESLYPNGESRQDLDVAFLQRCGCGSRLAEWEARCRKGPAED